MEQNIIFVKCDGTNQDFIANCNSLDDDLDRRVGKEIQRDKYKQYNTLEKITEAVMIYINDMPVGGGAIRKYDEVTMEIKRIYIHEEYQGKGLGTQLVRYLEDWAKELGYNKLVLETGELLTEAYRLYTRCGFKRIKNYGPYVDMQESLCMGKEL